MNSTDNQVPVLAVSGQDTKLRKPTQQELDQLKGLLMVEGEEEENAAGWISQAFVAVFDNYCTCCPGYQGRLMTIVWDGGPSLYDVYIWRDGHIVHVDKDQ